MRDEFRKLRPGHSLISVSHSINPFRALARSEAANDAVASPVPSQCGCKLTPTLGSSGYRHNPVTWMDLPVLSRGHSCPPRVARAPSPFPTAVHPVSFPSGGHPGTATHPSAPPPSRIPEPQEGSRICHSKTYQRFFESCRTAPHVGPHLRTAGQARPLGVRPLGNPHRPPIDSQLAVPASPDTLSGARAQQESRRGARARRDHPA